MFPRKLHNDQRGVAAVEAALVLPVLLTLVLGAVDASNLLIQTHRVEQGLSLAGSYLSKSDTPTAHMERARRLAVSSSVDGSGNARVPGWTARDITISLRETGGDFRSGDRARVTRLETSHTYQGFGFLRAVTRGRISVSAVHEERVSL